MCIILQLNINLSSIRIQNPLQMNKYNFAFNINLVVYTIIDQTNEFKKYTTIMRRMISCATI